ncbi:MAG: GDSL-type esterase/lipase family protein [Bacteroidota bacterium]
MIRRMIPLAFSFFLVFSACNEEEEIISTPNDPTRTSLNTIMTLGASRVEGARPEFESYRYELWKLLLDGGWEFDYIGTQKDPANYPTHASKSFDTDHEGRGGWTSGQILSGIEDWLNEAGAPDIVLFSSPGGNDALEGLSYEEALANVNAIIDAIQVANPNVTIIIEQLAPARSDLMTAELTTFFNRMQEDVVTLASQQSTANSQVLTVDMATGFKDSFLADDVHYNEAGARFIANQYYDVMQSVWEAGTN